MKHDDSPLSSPRFIAHSFFFKMQLCSMMDVSISSNLLAHLVFCLKEYDPTKHVMEYPGQWFWILYVVCINHIRRRPKPTILCPGKSVALITRKFIQISWSPGLPAFLSTGITLFEDEHSTWKLLGSRRASVWSFWWVRARCEFQGVYIHFLKKPTSEISFILFENSIICYLHDVGAVRLGIRAPLKNNHQKETQNSGFNHFQVSEGEGYTFLMFCIGYWPTEVLSNTTISQEFPLLQLLVLILLISIFVGRNKYHETACRLLMSPQKGLEFGHVGW